MGYIGGFMSSKIVFLGTAGDSVVIGKQWRSSGGIIISIGDLQFVLDPGPGTLVKACQYGVNIRETSAVLVSHAHLNHAHDLNAIITGMTYNDLDKHGVVVANSTVVNGIEDKVSPAFSIYHRKCVEKVIVMEAGKKLGIENVEVHAIPALHSDPNTIGFKFFTPDFVLSYSSDTGYSPKLAEYYAKSDILILNVVLPTGEKSNNLLSTDDAIKIIAKAKPKLAIITHFGAKMLNADPIQEARKITSETRVQTVAATDGLTINPVSYSAAMRQKTLNLY